MTVDWKNVRRVLVVRLRSIGDTVLATPSLIALREFLPDAQIDILLEDWVAPLLEGLDAVDNVIAVGKGAADRMRTAWELNRRGYDVAINLHGGTTGTFFTFASGARHRIGYTEYQYSFLYNHLLTSASEFWQKQHTHSAEQQLALLGYVGVPFEPDQRSRLPITEAALDSVSEKFADIETDFALMHPAAAFDTKQWATERFARTAEFLHERGLNTVAVAAPKERGVLEKLRAGSRVAITAFDNLSLPEITALASRARLFVGNDSGIAHIAAAVNTPTVVIFGSSNINHWRPWTDVPNAVVREELPCQPCPGYECKEFGDPKCIRSVMPDQVYAAIDRVLEEAKKAGSK